MRTLRNTLRYPNCRQAGLRSKYQKKIRLICEIRGKKSLRLLRKTSRTLRLKYQKKSV